MLALSPPVVLASAAVSRCFVFIWGSFSLLWPASRPNLGLQNYRPLLYLIVPNEDSVGQAVFVKERRQPEVPLPGSHVVRPGQGSKVCPQPFGLLFGQLLLLLLFGGWGLGWLSPDLHSLGADSLAFEGSGGLGWSARVPGSSQTGSPSTVAWPTPGRSLHHSLLP